MKNITKITQKNTKIYLFLKNNMKIIPNFKICTFEKAPIEDGTGNKFWQKTNKSVPFCIEFIL